MFLINFKTYKESTGERGVGLFKTVVEIASNSQIKFVVCTAITDLKEIAGLAASTNVEVWAQHTDSHQPGQSTGWVTPESLALSGAKGVLLNHSEHKLPLGVLNETVVRAKQVGLKTLIFAENIKEAIVAKKLKAEYVGYEPGELVGSTQTSVARAKPEIIAKVVEKMGETPVIVGAGVKDREDVETSLRLGAVGIGVSSSVILSENQSATISSMLAGFNPLPQPTTEAKPSV